jgi:hypothetical protein
MRSLGWIILVVTPLILFWRIAFAGRVLFWGVPLLQFYPWQQFAAEMWRSGNMPLWNPFVGNGAPLAANLQSAVFYPLNVLYLILPVEQAMGYTAVLHVILAGLAMYAWGRVFGLRPLAALVGALAFQLSQFFIARMGFLSITATFPWLAVWLWRAEMLAQRRRLSDALWLALTIGLGLLAGHAQTAGLGLIVVLCYAVVRSISNRSIPNTQYRLSVIRYWILALAVGAALASVQLLPSLELAAESQRTGGLDYEFAVTHSLHPLRLLTFLAPDLQGNPADGNFWGYDNYWENAGYVGIWALLMALFALSNFKSPILRLRSGQVPNLTTATWFFGATALVSLLIALGRFAPFFPLLFRVLPGASLFQGPARLLSVYTLAVAALAGIGTEQLLSGDRLHTLGRYLLAAAVAVLLAVIAGVTLIHIRAVFVRPVIQFGVTLGVCAACLAFRPDSPDAGQGGARFKLWQIALIGVVAGDLLVADWRLNPTTDASLYQDSTASASAVRAAGDGRVLWFANDEADIKFTHYLSFNKFGPEDTAYWLRLRETLLPNSAMIERVLTANNFDSLLVSRYNDVVTLLNKLPEADALRMSSVMDARYIVSPRELPLPVVQRGADVTIYRNDAAPGRAWIVPQAQVVSDSVAALADPLFDPRQVVQISNPQSLIPNLQSPTSNRALPVTSIGAKDAIQSLQDSSNAVTIHAESESGGFLVLADTFYPGWQATLDGTPVEILRANHAFRAIVFPPGEHTVVFRYEPLSFRVGGAISLVTLAGLIGALIAVSLRRRA